MTETERTSTLFRDVNARIRALSLRWGVTGPAGFVCECAHVDCTETLPLSVAEYDAILAQGARWVVARGHEAVAGRSSPAPAFHAVGVAAAPA